MILLEVAVIFVGVYYYMRYIFSDKVYVQSKLLKYYFSNITLSNVGRDGGIGICGSRYYSMLAEVN